MKTINSIIVVTFALIFGMGLLYAQDDDCTRFKAIAGNAYQVKDYEKVVNFYNKAQDECGTLGMQFYNPFIYAIKQSMRNATTEEAQNAYLDTLIMVYETAQKTHGLQEEWQNDLGYNYLKLGTPGAMKKADDAYKVGIHASKENSNKGYLQQYYLNLYNLWVQEQDEKEKSAYKQRMITEYFPLMDYATKGEMGVEITNFLYGLMSRVATDCESLLPEINSFMHNLPQDVEAKKAMVNNFMELLEDKKCTSSKEYAMLVDTIIAIDPSVDAIIAKAKFELSQGKTSNAINTFRSAKDMAETADQKSEIEYQIALAYYNSGSYRAAHDAGIAVSGKNSAKGYEIAARSVNKLMNDCGVSTFERKTNNYYAVELAEKSGNTSLVSSFKAQCPTSSDIFNASKSVGDTVTLGCWNKNYTIQTY
ncbi:MAG: hypothetical protein WC994_03050 [Brumimicrobium sp.]